MRQYFLDINHWNETNLPESRIDPDPDGSVVRMAAALEKFIHQNEETKVIDI